MGILDDAIREHLDLKRKHGAAEDELQRQEEEALGPARREVAPAQAQDTNGAGESAAAEASPDAADEPLARLRPRTLPPSPWPRPKPIRRSRPRLRARRRGAPAGAGAAASRPGARRARARPGAARARARAGARRDRAEPEPPPVDPPTTQPATRSLRHRPETPRHADSRPWTKRLTSCSRISALQRARRPRKATRAKRTRTKTFCRTRRTSSRRLRSTTGSGSSRSLHATSISTSPTGNEGRGHGPPPNELRRGPPAPAIPAYATQRRPVPLDSTEPSMPS